MGDRVPDVIPVSAIERASILLGASRRTEDAEEAALYLEMAASHLDTVRDQLARADLLLMSRREEFLRRAKAVNL